MYGTQYYRGVAGQGQSVFGSPQSGPAPTESQPQAQPNPYLPNAKRYAPSFQGAQQFNPNAPGTSIYDQYEQAPTWLQSYVEQRVKGEGQAGYYDPALQIRDIYQNLSPQIQNYQQKYGSNDFSNPYFYKNAGAKNLFEHGKFDPFNYGGSKMQSPFLTQAPEYEGNWFGNMMANKARKSFQLQGIDPYSGKKFGVGAPPPKASAGEELKWSKTYNQYIPIYGKNYNARFPSVYFPGAQV